MDFREQVCDRLKEVMKERKVTKYGLVKRSGLPRSTVYRVVNGKQVPTIVMLKQMLDSLDVSVVDFFAWDEDSRLNEHLTMRDMEMLRIEQKLTGDEYQRVRGYAEALIAERQKKNRH